jgi:hypothetical protein
MRFSRLLLVLAATLTAPGIARADLLITVDKSRQQMTVEEDGALLYTWPVSTGAPGYATPSGDFKPFRMERDHFSREWDDAPMPNSIFFTREGHAIHGSEHTKAIGRPVSHGCVRLMPKNAAILFDLVKQEGMNHTRVVLDGETPGGDDAVAAKPRYRDSYGNIVVSGGRDSDYTASAPPRRARPTPRFYRAGSDYYAPRRYYYARPPFPFPFGW